ncbi:MAG: hypothetical protein AzoDbin1_00065 [Azoarcus sp.]|uniref:Thioredoxin domain-containing protein n=1 Tax=Aromatoleum tolulyticum TaxID=34027 RepID=A0A1N6TXV0_9RHOO|nr:hypothetical protein [Aromatoleum tolulyticum]MCK9983593.1 hypothetical protein [Azoarcus sp.]SIQ58193.1 hypothetical protein SAMN05421829_105149 [Aromatoleum tolulyticum]
MKIRHVVASLCWCVAAACGATEFQALDRAAATRIVDPSRHTVPTIVALWSSECVHCKKNLKLFAEMVKADRRFRLVTVAVEPQFAGLAEPLDLLAVPGQRFAYGAESPEALGYALDSKWRGELPRTIFFDGKGGKTALSGVVTEATVRSSLGLQTNP